MGLAKKVITPWGVVAFTAMAILTYILWHVDHLTWDLCKASSLSVKRMAPDGLAPHSPISFRITLGASCALSSFFRTFVVFDLE